MKTLIVAGVAILLAATIAAARSTPQSSGGDDAVSAGRAVYEKECMSCHGEAATGHGPVAPLLVGPVPDLTRLADYEVPFPRDGVRWVLTGRIRLEPSHGFEMPVWQTSLNAPVAPGGPSRLDALLSYLEAIQRRRFGDRGSVTPADLAAAGKTLFERHCAGCHGQDGRGVTSGVLVVGAPVDLTAIAARNGGNFELRKVYEYIAGCDRDRRDAMPRFERSLTAAGWQRALTMKNIEALATYVESIQR